MTRVACQACHILTYCLLAILSVASTIPIEYILIFVANYSSWTPVQYGPAMAWLLMFLTMPWRLITYNFPSLLSLYSFIKLIISMSGNTFPRQEYNFKGQILQVYHYKSTVFYTDNKARSNKVQDNFEIHKFKTDVLG